MLNDKQSLILTGLMVASIFVFGILKILDNFIVLTILTIMFFAIVINIFYSKTKAEETLKEVPIQYKKVFYIGMLQYINKSHHFFWVHIIS